MQSSPRFIAQRLPYKLLGFLSALVLSSAVLAHDDHHTSPKAPVPASSAAVDAPVSTSQLASANLWVDVYKSESCGCCTLWIEKLETAQIGVRAFHPTDLNAVKEQLGITPKHQSCHTAVSKDGYFFEGHVPVAVMQAFLANPPAGARGLAVPGMPIGSPGMEMGERFHAYDVVQINADGTESVYAHIATLEESLR